MLREIYYFCIEILLLFTYVLTKSIENYLFVHLNNKSDYISQILTSKYINNHIIILKTYHKKNVVSQPELKNNLSLKTSLR